MALRRFLLAWLAFALVAAQGLAFMHRVVHVPHAQASQASQAKASPIAALFAHHEDDSTCRLFDAVGHDAVASHPAILLTLALPAFILDTLQGECLARFSAQFEARAPPAIR